MAVPDFQTIMLPLLRYVGKIGVTPTRDAIEGLGIEMGLSDADKMELLDSGTQTRWANRVSWAASYLFQAKILQRPKKGTIEVTDRGREILKSPPEKITVKWLNQFPEFQEFQAKSKSVANGVEK